MYVLRRISRGNNLSRDLINEIGTHPAARPTYRISWLRSRAWISSDALNSSSNYVLTNPHFHRLAGWPKFERKHESFRVGDHRRYRIMRSLVEGCSHAKPRRGPPPPPRALSPSKNRRQIPDLSSFFADRHEISAWKFKPSCVPKNISTKDSRESLRFFPIEENYSKLWRYLHTKRKGEDKWINE